MSLLTPAASEALPGPAWLHARRAAAAEQLAAHPLPTADAELWRYSRIGEVDLARYTLATAPELLASTVPGVLPEDRAGLVVLVDGAVSRVEIDETLAAKGVQLGRAADLDPDGASFAPVAGPTDGLSVLHEAFCADPVVLRVPRGVAVDRPFLVIEHSSGGQVASFPRLTIEAADGAVATVVHLQTSGPGGGLVVPVTQVVAHGEANVRYLVVQDVDAATFHLGRLDAEAAQQATVVLGAAAFGGRYGRLATSCRLAGRGATAQLLSLYFANGDQMLDFRTFQDHVAPDCQSDLLFKGVIDDRAHSVYSGLIRVGTDARGTNANQVNRNVKLSEEAWAESVPNLEIHNNDVRCSHASAVGPIDEDQRFYLESRGIPTRVAERLIVAGFFSDVLARFGVGPVVGAIEARIAEKLGSR